MNITEIKYFVAACEFSGHRLWISHLDTFLNLPAEAGKWLWIINPKPSAGSRQTRRAQALQWSGKVWLTSSGISCHAALHLGVLAPSTPQSINTLSKAHVLFGTASSVGKSTVWSLCSVSKDAFEMKKYRQCCRFGIKPLKQLSEGFKPKLRLSGGLKILTRYRATVETPGHLKDWKTVHLLLIVRAVFEQIIFYRRPVMKCRTEWFNLVKWFSEHIYLNTLRKKGTKAITGAVHFQKIKYCTLFTSKRCILAPK